MINKNLAALKNQKNSSLIGNDKQASYSNQFPQLKQNTFKMPKRLSGTGLPSQRGNTVNVALRSQFQTPGRDYDDKVSPNIEVNEIGEYFDKGKIGLKSSHAHKRGQTATHDEPQSLFSRVKRDKSM